MANSKCKKYREKGKSKEEKALRMLLLRLRGVFIWYFYPLPFALCKG